MEIFLHFSFTMPFQVVSVRGGGTLGVVVQGLHTKKAFCMEHRGTITSLKFAPDHSILAVQRTPNALVS